MFPSKRKSTLPLQQHHQQQMHGATGNGSLHESTTTTTTTTNSPVQVQPPSHASLSSSSSSSSKVLLRQLQQRQQYQYQYSTSTLCFIVGCILCIIIAMYRHLFVFFSSSSSSAIYDYNTLLYSYSNILGESNDGNRNSTDASSSNNNNNIVKVNNYYVSLINVQQQQQQQQQKLNAAKEQESSAENTQLLTTEETVTTTNILIDDDVDKDCIFRHSPIYRKVFVYPNPNEEMELFQRGDVLSEYGKNNSHTYNYPFMELNELAKNHSWGHYNIYGQNVQYTTELLIREIMIHPQSCLRTYNPEEATLFYIPYLPSIEHHVGSDGKTDYSTSLYGKAILDMIDNNDYTGWETTFGYTSKYWQRYNGSDHILVFSEPMHGLFHPRNRRGNYHFIHSQKQLAAPIVISVELSTTFIEMYPKCTTKNILVPYPNTNGNWFNGNIQQQANELIQQQSLSISNAALSSEKDVPLGRPIGQYYAAGNHGTCKKLRLAMQSDYRQCSTSYTAYEALKSTKKGVSYDVGMRLATFCPAPGGDSPSAKRMYDALIAGCIPIILSYDFVWPFTIEFDNGLSLDPYDFSIRLNASDYDTPLLDHTTCQPINNTKPGLQAYLESIPVNEIERLRNGVRKAGALYSWYNLSTNIPANPLQVGILPNGGTAQYVVQALSERASDSTYNNQQRWLDCQQEIQLPHIPDPKQFKC